MEYNPEEAYLVITDASNYQDCGGWGALVKEPGTLTPHVMCGSICHLYDNTYREELIAFIEALYFIANYHDRDDGLEMLVYWMCDNQTLVRQVNGEISIETHQDIWIRYDHLSSDMYIHAQHIPRDTDPAHNEMDLLASTLRLAMKDFKEDINIEDMKQRHK